MRLPTQRAQVVEAARKLADWGLNRGTAGNVSVRVEGGFFITPSGLPYEELRPDDIVEVKLDGRVPALQKTPSTEWRMHRDLYVRRPEVGAVAHTHSMYCTTLSCARKELPAVHYMIALAGTHLIRCARYATFGTAELSANALEALGSSKACLLSNHGMIAVGEDLREAIKLAREVETLAEQYWRTLQIGGPVLLDEEEIRRVQEKFETYGQPVHLRRVRS